MSLVPVVAAIDVVLGVGRHAYGTSGIGPPIATKRDNSRYVPTVWVVESNLNAFSDAERRDFVLDALAETQTTRLSALEQISGYGWLTGRLDGGLGAVARPNPAWPSGAAIVNYSHLIDVNGTTVDSVDTRVAWDTLRTWESTSDYTGPTDAAFVATLLRDLVSLRNVYSRVLAAAKAAASVPDMTLPLVLALYRVEGDLLMPPEFGSLDLTGIVPISRLDHSQDFIDGWPWIGTCSLLFADTAPVPLADRIMYADVVCSLAISGLDIAVPGGGDPHAHRMELLTAVDPTLSATLTPDESLQEYRGLVYRAARHDPSTADDFVRRRRLLLSSMDLTGAWVSAPLKPVDYVSSILVEGARLFNAYRLPAILKLDALPWPLPDVLAYLLFHQGVKKTRHIIRSAIYFSQQKAVTPQAQALGVRIDAVFHDLDYFNTLEKDALKTEMTPAHWETHYVPLLTFEDTLETLLDFMLTASLSVWGPLGAWETPNAPIRSNIIRFHSLVEFYNSCFR